MSMRRTRGVAANPWVLPLLRLLRRRPEQPQQQRQQQQRQQRLLHQQQQQQQLLWQQPLSERKWPLRSCCIAAAAVAAAATTSNSSTRPGYSSKGSQQCLKSFESPAGFGVPWDRPRWGMGALEWVGPPMRLGGGSRGLAFLRGPMTGGRPALCTAATPVASSTLQGAPSPIGRRGPSHGEGAPSQQVASSAEAEEGQLGSPIADAGGPHRGPQGCPSSWDGAPDVGSFYNSQGLCIRVYRWRHDRLQQQQQQPEQQQQQQQQSEGPPDGGSAPHRGLWGPPLRNRQVRGVVLLVHGLGEHCRSHFFHKPLLSAPTETAATAAAATAAAATAAATAAAATGTPAAAIQAEIAAAEEVGDVQEAFAAAATAAADGTFTAHTPQPCTAAAAATATAAAAGGEVDSSSSSSSSSLRARYLGSWVEGLNALGFDVVGLDLQGHGASDGWGRSRCLVRSLDDLAGDLLLLLRLVKAEYRRGDDPNTHDPSGGDPSGDDLFNATHQQHPAADDAASEATAAETDADAAAPAAAPAAAAAAAVPPVFLMGLSLGGWVALRAVQLAAAERRKTAAAAATTTDPEAAAAAAEDFAYSHVFSENLRFVEYFSTPETAAAAAAADADAAAAAATAAAAAGSPLGLQGLVLLSPMLQLSRRRHLQRSRLLRYAATALAAIKPHTPLTPPPSVRVRVYAG